VTNPPQGRHEKVRGGARHSADSLHKDKVRAIDPEALHELRSVVALLRALPDPAPPADLSERVLAHIDAQESSSWRRILRTGVTPVLGSALAAGVAGLMFFNVLRPVAPESGAAWRDPVVAMASQPATLSSAETAVPSRTRPPTAAALSSAAVVTPQLVYFGGKSLPEATPEFASLSSNVIDRGLDRQLNLMLLDPGAFFRRLETVRDRDRFVARLAARASRRGDAPQLALRLRPVAHRFAQTTSDQFLKASLIECSAQR
jgi:hypothetical protein